MVAITLTIFFEDPFWVAVVERQADGRLQAARHLFGGEPTPAEVLAFVLRRLSGAARRVRHAHLTGRPALRDHR